MPRCAGLKNMIRVRTVCLCVCGPHIFLRSRAVSLPRYCLSSSAVRPRDGGDTIVCELLLIVLNRPAQLVMEPVF